VAANADIAADTSLIAECAYHPWFFLADSSIPARTAT